MSFDIRAWVLETQRLVDKDVQLIRIQSWISQAQVTLSTDLSTANSYLFTFIAAVFALFATISATFVARGIFLGFFWPLTAGIIITLAMVVVLSFGIRSAAYKRYQVAMTSIYRALDELEKAVIASQVESAKGLQ